MERAREMAERESLFAIADSVSGIIVDKTLAISQTKHKVGATIVHRLFVYTAERHDVCSHRSLVQQ